MYQGLLDFSGTATVTDDAKRLADWLAANPGWHPARHLSQLLGMDKRQIRAAASASKGAVISAPGSKGYAHRRHTTADERHACELELRRQAQQMARRADEIANGF